MSILFNNKKTAICISGIPKYWNKGLHSLHKWFNGTDVFIHTWNIQNDEINNTTVHDTQWYSNLNSNYNDYNNIINSYKPKLCLIENFSNKQQLWNTIHTNYLSKGIIGTNNISQFSMFYSIREACRLKKQYENENNFIYDIVVRMRFDSNISDFDNIDDFLANKEQVIIPLGNDWGNGINDQFCIANSDNMDKICECYTMYDQLVHTTGRYNAEINFRQHLENINIAPNKLLRKKINIGINNN